MTDTLAAPQRRIVGSRALAVLAGTFLAAFLVGLAPQAAHAGYAFSPNGYFTAGSTNYTNYAFMDTSSNYANAQTRTGPPSGYMPSGYAGSRGRLFTSGGSLSCEGANTFSNVGMTYPTNWAGYSCTRTNSDTWYSYGVSYGYNGNGYNAHYTFQTPYQSS